MTTRGFNRSVLLFQSMPLFADCRRRDLELIGQVADELAVPAGRRLLTQGELPRECFLIISGTAGVTIDGVHHSLAGPGTLLGTGPMLAESPQSMTVIALEASRVFSFDRRGLSQLLLCPPVARRIYAGTTLTSLGARTTTVRTSRPSSARTTPSVAKAS